MSRRAQNRAEQRARILDSARLLFSESGVDAVSVAEVAQQAGVARATVFNYFPSKGQMIDAITAEVFSYYVAMLAMALEDEEHPTPALVRALFRHMGAGIEVFCNFYRGVFREIAKLQVGLEEGSLAQETQAAAMIHLRALLSRGLERGDLVADHAVEDLASAFNALVNGTISHWLYEDSSDSLEGRMVRAAEIFLAGIAIESPAEKRASPPDLAPDVPTPEGAAGAVIDGLRRVNEESS